MSKEHEERAKQFLQEVDRVQHTTDLVRTAILTITHTLMAIFEQNQEIITQNAKVIELLEGIKTNTKSPL